MRADWSPGDPTTPAERFQASGKALAKLALALSEAEPAQWQAPPRIKPREDTTDRKPSGERNDPTHEIAANELRLQLREAVKHAENIFTLTERDAKRAEFELIEALAKWNGETSRDE